MRTGLLAAFVLGAAFVPSAQAAERPRFHQCRDAAPGARCGHLRVPLDRLDPAGPKLRSVAVAEPAMLAPTTTTSCVWEGVMSGRRRTAVRYSAGGSQAAGNAGGMRPG